ncbi:hypothetical protein ACK1LH_01530 [Metabacillus indicus]|uniref:hypothetical protein n=1 Tax=Metabacillus indicus TaxID=246786 RepID=UPI0039845761
MAIIPVKPALDFLKKAAPPVANFVKNNWKEAAIGVPSVLNEINKFNNSKGKSDKREIKLHHRKKQYVKYKVDILPKLNNMKRKELVNAKLEIEQFIQQIYKEEQEEFKAKKIVHSKRSSNWNKILIQIIDKIKSKDYQEYLLIYNNPDYKSEYFEGFDIIVKKFRNLISKSDTEELCQFIIKNTGKTDNEVKADFLLC